MEFDFQFLAGFFFSGLVFGVSWLLYKLSEPARRQLHEINNGDDRNLAESRDFRKTIEFSIGKTVLKTQTSPVIEQCESAPPVIMKTVHSQADFDSSLSSLWLKKSAENAARCSSKGTGDAGFSTTNAGRNLEELMNLMHEFPEDAIRQMSDEEIVLLLNEGKIRSHQLEKELGNELKAVHVRRKWLALKGALEQKLNGIPYFNYDYSFVSNSCCENVIGYIPIPLGFAGPLNINGKPYYVPMATTEGCLVASTNRGCSALQANFEGVRASVKDMGMTRGPVVMFQRAEEALKAKCWFERPDNYNFRFIKQKFDSTSRFASLKEVKCNVAGRLLFMRFVATTGDAMGMNMVSKATDVALRYMRDQHFPQMRIISLSGNFCVDKKPAAVNWIDGRGKFVVCDAVVPAKTIRNVLKSDVDALVELNLCKNMVGSAVSGSLGGFNAHSANIVTAIFLATGQDAAQVVSSSGCMTQVEKRDNGDLYISVTLPSLEVGTVGGGTILPPQRAALEMLGVSGSGETPGENAAQFARIIGATVLAGELSLLAALSSGDLVKSHIRHNRSSINLRSASSRPQPCSSTSIGAMRKSTSLEELGKSLEELAESSIKGTPLHPESCSKVLT